jgi:hypothetical protein
MYIASAYPNSDVSALTMIIIAVVMAASLAAWLGLVFLADRQPRGRREAEIKQLEPGEGLPAKQSGRAA